MEFEELLAVFVKLLDERLADQPERVAGRRGLRGFTGAPGVDGKDFVFSEHEPEFRLIAREVALKFSDLTAEEIESIRGRSGKDGRDARFNFEEHRTEIESILVSELSARADQLKLKFQDLTESDKAELKGVRGERGSNGKDFDFESHREDITHLIAESTLALVPDLKLKFSDLTDDDRAEIRGPRGQRGETGKSFEYSDHKSEIEAAIGEAHLSLVPELKLKFSDLTEDELILLRGSRGQRGKPGAPGKDFVFDEHREYFDGLKPKFADFSDEEKDSLKLKFENLTDAEKDSLKLKFENLTESDRAEIRGPRGQRGKNGVDGKDGERGPKGDSVRGLPGPVGLSGRPGIDGQDGADGINGVNAPTIIDIEIVERRGDWALQITMSDGSRLLTNWIASPQTKYVYGGGGGGYSADPATTNTGNGVVGKDGASAYDLWLSAGNSGSQSDFLTSLISTVPGPAGARGADSTVAGPVGATGAKGDTGTAGVAGAKGDVGAQGATGPSGAKGDKGDIGLTGASGAQGPAGPQGIQGPVGAPGTPGQNGNDGAVGAQGPAGESAYQIWLDNGNTGTEQDFLNSLKATSMTVSPTDNNVLLNIPCALDVYVNSVVRMSIDDFIESAISTWNALSNVLQMRSGTYTSVAVNALADQYKNCNIIGIVEKKSSPTMCNIRIAGITSDIFYGLDVTEEYFLSDIDPGKIVVTAAAPQAQGAVLLRVGQPISYAELLFQRGDRLVRGVSS